ncbi:MAG: ABC transporter ATP-binding protein [Alphaproteobacteria bacterium]|nr:ABC transporter ATP-binding protein [Alphaproteobacteria bacterium]MBE8220100.1 ABC transporter ATP-binding protein [Alphaproteobacteria bacterium]
MSSVLELRNICVSFGEADGKTLAILKGVDLSLAAGEMVALLGRSGSGKSSLLHVAGLLAQPNAGEIFIAGTSIAPDNDAERTLLRQQHIGFVYQFHNLLPEFSAVENIAIAARIAGVTKATAMDAAHALLARLGLAARASHLPSQLSGGEQQRVALARALVNKPNIILADEPTGNLDGEAAKSITDLLAEMAAETNVAILVATHDLAFASAATRTIKLENGTIA